MKQEEEEKEVRRSKRRKRRSNSETNGDSPTKWIKEEEAAVAVQSISVVRWLVQFQKHECSGVFEVFFNPFCFDDLQEVDATTGNDLALHLDGQTEHVDVEKSDGGERVVVLGVIPFRLRLSRCWTSDRLFVCFLSRLQSSMRFT